jgi:alpha-amylase
VEQIHDAVDEGTGLSYPFTDIGQEIGRLLDPTLEQADLANLVKKSTCSRNKNRP